MIQGEDCAYDASPSAALSAVREHEGPVIIDVDETLYLRNSTEDFLDCAQPGVLGLLVLRALDAFQPWRLSGEDTRDTWRVGVIVCLFPWTFWIWRRRV